MTCPRCGASNRHDAAWCGQCQLVLEAPAAVATPGRAVPVATLPAPAFTYSRWRKTTTTFGPVGRSSWTVATALVMAMAVFSQNPFAIGPLCFIAAPLVLRSVWAKGRVT